MTLAPSATYLFRFFFTVCMLCPLSFSLNLSFCVCLCIATHHMCAARIEHLLVVTVHFIAVYNKEDAGRLKRKGTTYPQ